MVVMTDKCAMDGLDDADNDMLSDLGLSTLGWATSPIQAHHTRLERKRLFMPSKNYTDS